MKYTEKLRRWGFDLGRRMHELTEGKSPTSCPPHVERAASTIDTLDDRIIGLRAQLLDCVETLEILAESNTSPGHVTYRSKARIADIAARTASNARAKLCADAALEAARLDPPEDPEGEHEGSHRRGSEDDGRRIEEDERRAGA